jgi:hypothetical protein
VTNARGVLKQAGQRSQSASAQRARLDRVHAAAQVWLGVLTTLLGLLGSVVLFKGGDLVTGITANVALQWALIGLVGLVFASAVLAVLAGGVATWGGLSDPSAKASSESGGVLRKWQQLLLRVVLRAALTPSADRDAARRESVTAQAGDLDWAAERNRIYLHASRTLGVAAAAFIALLAIGAVVAGTLSPVPSEVIVVYHGQLSCVPASNNLKYTDVTQVVPVNSC